MLLVKQLQIRPQYCLERSIKKILRTFLLSACKFHSVIRFTFCIRPKVNLISGIRCIYVYLSFKIKFVLYLLFVKFIFLTNT